jgi:GTP pyrophosphokinase
MSPQACALPPELADLPFREADKALIGRAYAVAAYWHRDQWRRSGDPYVTHCVAVARILAAMGMDAALVCAGLLHDVPADTACPRDLLPTQFGQEITALVDTVIELDSLQGASADAVLQAAGPRALALKLADRLHNMQTIGFISPDRQQRKSRETLDVFAPLAARLGLHQVGSELELLARATIDRRRTAHPVGLAGDVRVFGGALRAMSALLPPAGRAHWVEEWTAELHVVPRRRDRARFTAHLLVGMPKLAITLRRNQE